MIDVLAAHVPNHPSVSCIQEQRLLFILFTGTLRSASFTPDTKSFCGLINPEVADISTQLEPPRELFFVADGDEAGGARYHKDSAALEIEGLPSPAKALQGVFVAQRLAHLLPNSLPHETGHGGLVAPEFGTQSRYVVGHFRFSQLPRVLRGAEHQIREPDAVLEQIPVVLGGAGVRVCPISHDAQYSRLVK
ncbi:hypothetical protein OGATHE_005981 [Ogataea polymorpha]|uniref:Uncharacterized protein n=1 Tax=Ogataea polymorpha TaxID=460523 RepID=A0A9P8NVC9_9ASCO|nr:hypothetical protein OGATHE_005981 [Ogataea polymorpha]